MLRQRKTLLAVIWGVTASLFLSSTFIINSIISGSGGHWAWTAALRSIFLIPILGIVLFFSRQLSSTIIIVKKYPLLFLKWGLIGFGALYTALALASLWSPGWLIAATFQINILAGIVLAPFIYPDHRKHIPKRPLILTLVILSGVFIMQFEKIGQLNTAGNILLSFFLVLIGAVVWPLGNRKLMIDLEHRNMHMNALQRVFGMTLGCLPLLVILCLWGYHQAGPPSFPQCEASFYSAIFSGFLGGAGFYQAMQLVSRNTVALAAIEATQALEILFTMLGEMMLKGLPMPGIYARLGLGLIVIGLLTHFLNTWAHNRTNRVLT